MYILVAIMNTSNAKPLRTYVPGKRCNHNHRTGGKAGIILRSISMFQVLMYRCLFLKSLVKNHGCKLIVAKLQGCLFWVVLVAVLTIP